MFCYNELQDPVMAVCLTAVFVVVVVCVVCVLVSRCLMRDRLCGPVVRVPYCRPRGPGFDSWRYQIFLVTVGLERGPLSPCEDK
jgi:hypothetical protein